MFKLDRTIKKILEDKEKEMAKQDLYSQGYKDAIRYVKKKMLGV